MHPGRRAANVELGAVQIQANSVATGDFNGNGFPGFAVVGYGDVEVVDGTGACWQGG